MSNINEIVQAKTKLKFSVAIQSDVFRNLIQTTLGDKNRSTRFIASISSAVAVNPSLQECDAGTIISGALVGESLGLSPSPALGHFYLVPYNDNKNNRKVATFQLGYVGFINLAMKSGQYKKINAVAIKKGELVKFDPISEEIELNMIDDDDERDATETIGYYAFFELHNGFKKALYWTKNKMEKHANRYSQAFRNKQGSSFWIMDFDIMAKKTMLRQLISKWGIMSNEMQQAYEVDQAVVNEDMAVSYIDNDNSDLKENNDD